jgi:hypothetical protein
LQSRVRTCWPLPQVTVHWSKVPQGPQFPSAEVEHGLRDWKCRNTLIDSWWKLDLLNSTVKSYRKENWCRITLLKTRF